jgi:uncharacterized protein (DUF2249 family)
MANTELDVRPLRKTDKRPAIFATYADLPVGDSFVVINDRDPKHVHEEFEADYAASCGWEYIEKGPTVWRIRISKLTTTPLPRVLKNAADIASADVPPRTAGQRDVPRHELDWNVITLAPSGGIDNHTRDDVDVLIHVLSGSGRLTTEKGAIELAPGALMWLPRRLRRQFTAGPDGLRCLTVNQKWEILPPTAKVR